MTRGNLNHADWDCVDIINVQKRVNPARRSVIALVETPEAWIVV